MTIQRLYSIILSHTISRSVEEESLFELEESQDEQLTREVRYNPAVPIETFDIIVIDECHRSIYGTWRSILEYFDAFLIGLTGTEDTQVNSFFKNNVVYKQPLEIVQRLWLYCNILRDDGLSYGDYIEQLTYLLFLKMEDERTRPPYNEPSLIPSEYNWQSLKRLEESALIAHFNQVLKILGNIQGIAGVIFYPN